MALSSELPGSLSAYSDRDIRALAKSYWLSYRVPSEEELSELLKPFFAAHKIPARGMRRALVRTGIGLLHRRNQCEDELGGVHLVYDDRVRVHLVSTMGLKKIQAAFMKARNQARRKKPRR